MQKFWGKRLQNLVVPHFDFWWKRRPHCEHFWFQKRLLSNSNNWKIFNFCCVWRFFKVEIAKCASAELGKIINFCKKFGENEENLANFTIILMAAFGTKNVHSVMLVSDFLSELKHRKQTLYLKQSCRYRDNNTGNGTIFFLSNTRWCHYHVVTCTNINF